MIAYQRALARALAEGEGEVPGVPAEAVARFARQAERKLAALHRPRGRPWFERWLRVVKAW